MYVCATPVDKRRLLIGIINQRVESTPEIFLRGKLRDK
jgi:hypothetical protein